MYAITPLGVGKHPGARRVRPGAPLSGGETFVADVDDIDGLVLAEDGISLRAETQADRDTVKAARVTDALQALFTSSDPEEQLLAMLLKEIAKDIAQLRGITPAQYRDEIIASLLS